MFSSVRCFCKFFNAPISLCLSAFRPGITAKEWALYAFRALLPSAERPVSILLFGWLVGRFGCYLFPVVALLFPGMSTAGSTISRHTQKRKGRTLGQERKEETNSEKEDSLCTQ